MVVPSLSSLSAAARQLALRVLGHARDEGLEAALLREPLVVGVSGGPDSLVLLHILVALRVERAPSTLHVAHLDHGFRGEEGEADAAFVAETAREWGLPCSIARADVPSYARKERLSPEDAARRARYVFLGYVARLRQARVAVAHTADDQAETVLMNILRGAGTRGLGGMAPVSEVCVGATWDGADTGGPGAPKSGITEVMVLRPVLSVWRTEIEAYCRAEGLQPRVDASNAVPDYARNRLRLDLMPLLQSHYSPGIKERLVSLSDVVREEDSELERQAGTHWERIAETAPDRRWVSLPSAAVRDLPLAIARRVVRRALQVVAHTLQDFTFAHTEGALAVIGGRKGSPASINLPNGIVVERAGSTAIVRPANEPLLSSSALPAAIDRWPSVPAGFELIIEPGQTARLERGWELRSEVVDEAQVRGRPGDLLALFDYDLLKSDLPLLLRTRRPGDRIEPLGTAGHKSLQDLFVDARIPRLLRDHLPLLAAGPDGETILWVPGPRGRRSSRAPVTEGTGRVLTVEFARKNAAGGASDSAGNTDF